MATEKELKYYIATNETEAKAIQTYLFDKGFTWHSGDRKFRNFYLDENKTFATTYYVRIADEMTFGYQIKEPSIEEYSEDYIFLDLTNHIFNQYGNQKILGKPNEP